MGLFLNQQEYEDELKYWESELCSTCTVCNGSKLNKINEADESQPLCPGKGYQYAEATDQ